MTVKTRAKKEAPPPKTTKADPGKVAEAFAGLKQHYKGPPAFETWCTEVTKEVVGKTAQQIGPVIQRALINHFGVTPQAASGLGQTIIHAIEADPVATDTGVASKLLSVLGRVVPGAAKVAGWGGVALGAGLAAYEFKKGDAFAAGSSAGSAVLGGAVVVGAIPASAAVAGSVLVAGETMAAKKLYETAYLNISGTFRTQYFGGDPKQIRQFLLDALGDPTAGDDVRQAQAKAFNDFLDRDFLANGAGVFGGGGHRDFTTYLEGLSHGSPDWNRVITTFYSRRTQDLDSATEQWVAKAMQEAAVLFLDQEVKQVR